MRTKLVLPLLLGIICSVSGQSGSGLFETDSPAVVYIQQAVKILPEYFTDTRTLTLLEKKIDRSLLNGYIGIESGSGFFIDRQGHIITNNHVIDISSLKKNRENAAQYWSRYIDDTFKDDEMKSDDRRTLKVDLFKAMTQGPFALQVLVGNKDFYDAHVVAASTKPDLAVLKIEIDGNPVLSMAASDSLKVGDDLYSIGYPFGSDVVRKFTELSAAFTKGAVSAFREEKWIQHTATINPGNSGGPLLNAQGQVVGVNSALRTNANNTYFAIPVSTVRDFLAANSLASLAPEPVAGVPAVESAPLPGLPLLHQNSLGEYEVSNDLIFNQEKGSTVSIDGKTVGVTPLFFNPETAVFDVKIEGQTGLAEGRLRVLKSLSGSTEVVLPWKPFTAKLTVSTEQPGVSITLDGKPLGVTPLTREVPLGKHTIAAQAQRWIFKPATVELARDDERTLAIEGERQIPVGFQGKGDRPALVAVQNGRTITVAPEDDFVLPSGSWNVSWEGNATYNGGSVTVEIGDKPALIDAVPFLAKGTLTFAKLDTEATIYLDGAVLGPAGSAPFAVEVGRHQVTVLERGFKPFSAKIYVTKSEASEVAADRIPSDGAWGPPALWTGAGLGLLGAGLTAYGFHQYSDSTALGQTSNYQDYTRWKNTARTLYSTGLAVAGGGVVIAAIGWLLESSLDGDTVPDKLGSN
jgi:S1-C subfamily serine protease